MIMGLLADANSQARVNPFVTRRVRPGAIPFLFPEHQSLELLLQQLNTRHGWGQIVGPHGSGKSTLLHTLTPELQRQGFQVEFFTLRRAERRLPLSIFSPPSWNDNTRVIVDGYEQLSWWSRLWLKLVCCQRGAGLLVTTHRDLGLTTLYQTEPSLATTQAVVDHLLASSAVTLSESDIARCFDQQQGNLRETLFMLYDLYRQKQR